MKLKSIQIKSATEPTTEQFHAAARAEYMRQCEILDALRQIFDEDFECAFFENSFVCRAAKVHDPS